MLVSEGVKGRADRRRVRPSRPGGTPPGVALPAPAPPKSGPQSLDYALGSRGGRRPGDGGVPGDLGALAREDLQDRCAPFCTESETNPTHTKLVVADVALGVGVAALVALYLHARPPSRVASGAAAPPRPPSLAVRAAAGGAGIGLTGAF